MSAQPGFRAAEQRRAEVTRVTENSARYASAFVSFQTTGWGEFVADTAVKFTTTFIERPAVAHAFSLDGDTLVEGRFPRVSAGVHKWLQDERGHYIGAWLFFVVETMGLQFQDTYIMPTPADGNVGTVHIKTPIQADPGYVLIHDFTFTGTAMKAIPWHNLVELQ